MCYLSWLGKSCLSKKGGFCTGGCLLKFHLININKHKIQNPHPSQQAHLPYPTFPFNSMTDRLQVETSHILTATDVMLHRSSWPFIYLLTMESFNKMPFWTPLVLKASGANTQGMTHLPTADASIKLLLPRSFLEHRWAMAESGGPTSPDVAMNFKHCRLFRLRHLSAKYKTFANKIPIRTTTYREARRHVWVDCENRANFYLCCPPPEKGKSPTLQVQVSAMNFPQELQLNSDGPLVPGAVWNACLRPWCQHMWFLVNIGKVWWSLF